MNPQVDRKVFRDLSYGLYIVTSSDKEKLNGQIVNTVIQVTSDPPRVAVIIPGSIFFGPRIPPREEEAMENLACYFIRASLLARACLYWQNYLD